jgi:hypothetical protein
MPLNSQSHEDTEMIELCQEHSKALARMDAKLDSIHEQTSKTNGRTTANESALSSIAAQMAVQQTMWVGAVQERQRLEARIVVLEASMGNMKDWKAEMRGGARGALMVAERLATIAALVVASWAAWSGHVQAVAAVGSR